ncbi:hybrid sensor histidine kinase/response regulator [Anabaena catenula]|uniref:histidine kinase n=1 Tax=Anabaena catenula FACHB-362 TaxID=2692877 RepID=A0ABR8IYC1_9NOST|nr:response regulator [Anabaena catenula]MBD2691090.1 response regulator [Anabaena catenula FACHB-362]
MKNPEQTTLLIVDDNPTNIKVLFDFLRESGFRVLIANDGQTTIERLDIATPDLILLDVMMPGLDGFETCKYIKSQPKFQNIPIIFMTALGDAENKVKGFSFGAVDYITKPFQQEEVLMRVNLHLKIQSLTQKLTKNNNSLVELNASLEQRIEQRTLELKKAQSQLVLNEKMSSLGQLVAGIAHEINNPVSFINGNLKYAYEYTQDIINLVRMYQKYYPEPVSEIADKLVDIDFDYLAHDFPKLLESLQEGTNRIANISKSMRIFSRVDTDVKIKFNIHDGLDSTLLILGHRLKANEQHPEIIVIKEYSILPEIECYPGQLNQVFMNILANAIDAVEETNNGRQFTDIQARPNYIYIRTKLQDNQHICIYIKDNGIGISPEIKNQLFEHYMTTKAVGKGTGLGLTISREIIEEKHGGKLEFTSIHGQGTEFVIELPLFTSNN